MPALKALGENNTPRVNNYDVHLKCVRDVSMYKMATASVPSGTILAVHFQKCSHLSNEIRVMQKKNRVSVFPRSSVKILMTGEIEKTRNLGFIS
jgi:hypothetical protein